MKSLNSILGGQNRECFTAQETSFDKETNFDKGQGNVCLFLAESKDLLN